MISGLIAALQFLTRIPIPINVDFNDKNLRNSILFFPFVGVLIGLLAGVPYAYIYPFNSQVSSILAILFLIIITGGMHIDGLSDTFDGFFSNRSKEKILEIMKDSRVGAFGVVSIIMYLLLEFVFLSNIKIDHLFVLMIAVGNARTVITYIISTKKSARSDGMGIMFQRTKPIKNFLIGLTVHILLILYINPYYIISLILNFIIGEYISYLSYKKIDGVTGDVYGTIILLGEITSLIGLWGIQTWIL